MWLAGPIAHWTYLKAANDGVEDSEICGSLEKAIREAAL